MEEFGRGHNIGRGWNVGMDGRTRRAGGGDADDEQVALRMSRVALAEIND